MINHFHGFGILDSFQCVMELNNLSEDAETWFNQGLFAHVLCVVEPHIFHMVTSDM